MATTVFFGVSYTAARLLAHRVHPSCPPIERLDKALPSFSKRDLKGADAAERPFMNYSTEGY
jgi:hypothetical protein